MLNVERYMGIPYMEDSSSFNGADCYGLFRLIQFNEYDKKLPEFNNIKNCTKEEKARIANLNLPLFVKEELTTPEEGCAVILSAIGGYWHIGLCIGDFMFIHTLKEHGPCIESLNSPRWMKRIEGFYRV